MKFNIDRKMLFGDLQVIDRVLSSSVVDNDICWLKKSENLVKLIAYGGIGYIELNICEYVEFDEDMPFEIAFKLSQVMHFAKNMKCDSINCLIGEGKISFIGLNSKWDIPTITRKAPNRPNKYDSTRQFIDIELSEIVCGMNRCKFSVDKNVTRAPLTGIYLKVVGKGLIVYSTDGVRISRYKIRKNYELQADVNIPAFSFDIIDKLSKIGGDNSRISIGSDYFVLYPKNERYFYYAPQEDNGKAYPDVAKFFKEDRVFEAKISKELLYDNIVLSQASDEDRPINLTMVFGEKLKIYAVSQTMHMDTLLDFSSIIKKPDCDIEVTINSKLLIEAISSGVINDEFSIALMRAPTQNLIYMLYLKDGNFDHLLAPVK